MIPIKINGSQYYYVSCQYDDGSHTSFYEKGTPIKKRKIKRKYWLFGPILKDELIEVDNFIFCFRISRPILDSLDNKLIILIKTMEEKYQRKKELITGQIEI